MTGHIRLVVLAAACWLFCQGRMHAGEGKKESTPIRLRILSYNIHHGEGEDRKLDLERIAKVILSVKPDLVSLQEVDRKVGRTKNVDQPAELARLTGMHVAFGGNISLQGGDYGNAVLSRFPIKRHANHKLPNFDKGEQRGVLEVEIEEAGLKMLFLATHLDHRRVERERLASAKWINEFVSKDPERAAILAGDLNATPESATLKELEKAWTRSNEKVLPTIPVEMPKQQIDYILLRPRGRWRVVETFVLPEAVASDHRGIMAVLEMGP